MENINRSVDDPFYRYKMPKLQSKIEGNGNGIKTVVPNMKEIAKSLCRPPEYTTKFFGFELGAQTIMDEKAGRYIINGSHDAAKLANILDVFIRKYVLCSACNNPETDMVLKKGKGKDKDLYLSCLACGKVSMADSVHKLATYIAKNPPPGTDKKGGKAQKKGTAAAGGTASPEETEVDADEFSSEPLVENISEALTAVKIEDPAELFATYIGSGEHSASDLAAEANRVNLSDDLAAAVLVQVLIDKNVVQQLKKHKTLFKEFAKSDKAQRGLIGGLERLVAVTHPDLFAKFPQILKLFYDADIIEEGVILAWDEKPSRKFVGDKDLAKKLHDTAAPFIEWLKNAEEESEDEDDD